MVRELPDQQTLDGSAAGHARSKQARGKYLRVVDHEKVTGVQLMAEVRERRMCDAATFALQYQQPRLAAYRRRFLRDQLVWKVEVEL